MCQGRCACNVVTHMLRLCYHGAPADCIISGGKVLITNIEEPGAQAQFENCHMSGSFLGRACVYVAGKASVLLRNCTLQVRWR
jgi:hypothetical protein